MTEHLNEALARVKDATGLDGLLGFVVDTVSRDGITGSLTITPDHHQPFGIVHGGTYCALAESAASISAFCWVQETGIGGTAVGVNNSTDFLRSVSDGVISVSTTAIHRGRRQQLWQVDMRDDQGRLIAQSRVRMQNIEM
ncbi:PaaI family thioesterase [Gordonia sp. MP11Mi]|uniref:Esterase n=1 Tax=Gordonia sp. MP11Mi TaxID=3022769 RepID=A0AA97GVQ5_9ACTN